MPDARAALTRAAWNNASILPARVDRSYRFGPPAVLRGVDGAAAAYQALRSDRCCLPPP